MDIVAALREEETRLQQRLKSVQGAISALSSLEVSQAKNASTRPGGKRTMSAAARARISKATKERWARFRAEKSKKGKR